MLLQNVRIALRALRGHALRSSLTLLGIVIGVGAVIAMVAVGAGAEARLAEQIESLGVNIIIVTANSAKAAGVRIGQGTRATLTDEDAAAIQREIPGALAAAPTRGGAYQAVHGARNWGTSVTGVTPEWFAVREWSVVAGRPITLDDHQRAAKVMVLGQTAADNLFGEEPPLGQTVRIGRVPFTVVGVLERKGQSPWGQDQDDVLMIPLSTARRQILGRIPGQARAIWVISVKIREEEDRAEIEAQIRELLRQRHRLHRDQDDDFDIRNPSDRVRAREAASETMTSLLGAIASVSLLLGGVGIMNVMLVSVGERTHEIGLRMAVGARHRDILAQFLTEAITLALIGGVLGIAAGMGGTWILAYINEWQTLIEPQLVLTSFGVAAAVGVVFGLYPASRAARLDPVEALRLE